MSVLKIDNFLLRKHKGWRVDRSLAYSMAGWRSVVTKESRVSQRLRFMLPVVLGTVLVSFLILKFAPAPFFWIWITWAAVFFSAIFCVQGVWPKVALLNVGVVACMLATMEGYLVTHEYTPPVYPDGDLYVHDDVLGWAPKKGAKVRAIKAGSAGLFHGPRGILFNVEYTIDSDGLRAAPPYRKNELAATILFFGCSFTFGDGLTDNETLPYQVGVQSGGRYRTLNFGVGGYGPEQMLAAIEHNVVSRLVDTPPRYAYYIALPAHVWRVAGRVAWGGHAPRYLLRADGTVDQVGYLEDRKALADRIGLRRGGRQLNKSAIWRVLSMHDYAVTDDDMRLYFAVVRRTRELLEAQNPGIQFRVILWSNEGAAYQRTIYEKMQTGFREMGIPFDRVEDILPGYKTNSLQYVLSPVDHHPNPLANRLLAQYILDKTVQ